MAGLIHEEPDPQDVERVREHLVAAGWPVVGGELSRGDESTEPDTPTGVASDSSVPAERSAAYPARDEQGAQARAR